MSDGIAQPKLLSVKSKSSSMKRVVRFADSFGPLEGVEYTAYGHPISAWFRDISLANFGATQIRKLSSVCRESFEATDTGRSCVLEKDGMKVETILCGETVQASIRLLSGSVPGTRISIDLVGGQLKPRFSNKGKLFSGEPALVLRNSADRVFITMTSTVMLRFGGSFKYMNHLVEPLDVLSMWSWARIVRMAEVAVNHPESRNDVIPELGDMRYYDTYYSGHGVTGQVEGRIGKLFGYSVICSERCADLYERIRSCGLDELLSQFGGG